VSHAADAQPTPSGSNVKSSFLGRVLEPPSYGYLRQGSFYVPTRRELWTAYDKYARWGSLSDRLGNDFNRDDLSINQCCPGYVAGEWHNNHHLYPTSARAGFLPHQLDLAWCTIRAFSWVGAVGRCKDSKADFYRNRYVPYFQGRQAELS